MRNALQRIPAGIPIDREKGLEEPIDLGRYIQIFDRHKWIIIGATFTACLIAAVILFLIEPVYRSTATLLIESQGPKVLAIDQVYEVEAPINEYLQTQFEILKSRDLARKVIHKLDLADDPEFKTDESDSLMSRWKAWVREQLARLKPTATADKSQNPDTTERLIDRFLENLTVTPRVRTQLVDLSYDSHDPALARRIVQTLGESYIESDLRARMQVSRKASKWLLKRSKHLRDKLAISEQKLQSFLEKNHLVDLEGVLTVAAKKIDTTTVRLTEARTARIEAESAHLKARALKNRITRGREVLPEHSNDPVIQGLKQQEAEISRKISDLAERYGPDHPSMLAARSELESIRASLRNQSSNLMSDIKNRYEIAKSNEQALLASLEDNQSEVQKISRIQAQLSGLQREVESDRALYEMFINRSKETFESANLNTASTRFVDRANRPSVPIKPNKKRNLILVFLSVLSISMAFALVREKMDSTLKSPDQVETLLAVPILGMVPLYRVAEYNEVRRKDPGTPIIVRPSSAFFESIRSIRTHMMLSALEHAPKTWLITSSVSQEGKSTIAVNLAFALSKMNSGKVLLIDADLRNSISLTERFSLLPRGERGLSHFLADKALWQNCIHSLGKNIDVIPAGEITLNPSELLSNQRFSALLEKVADHYTTILIDSPPIFSVSDAHLLARYVDAILYVVKANATPLNVIQNGLAQLQRFDSPVAGVVLNQVDLSNHRVYSGYGYGHRHGVHGEFVDV